MRGDSHAPSFQGFRHCLGLGQLASIPLLWSKWAEHKVNIMKLICTPLALEAMNLLDTGDYSDSLLESISLTNREYQQLWESDIIDKINNELGKTIDDYEFESINPHEYFKNLCTY